MSKRNKKIAIFLFLILLSSVSFLSYMKKYHSQTLLKSSAVHRIIPLYRSLRKLPDIVFMPWAAFTKNNLDTYELTINPRDIELMNTVLPEVPFSSFMETENKLWVSGYFRTKTYQDKVKVRYRGNQASHWNAYQKSYRIKFPKDNLYNGMRELTLVIPSKRRYFAMSLNNYRAEKLGLLYPDESLVRLKLNGADTGVLIAMEHWSQPWIEKLPMSALSTIYGVDEGEAAYEERWQSWNSEDIFDTEPLLALQEIVDHSDDETFKKIIPQLIDIEDWYAWDIMRILASGYHADPDTSFGANNLVLVFDRAEGRFKPVPYNTVLFTPDHREKIGYEGFIGAPSHLYQRILSIPEFKERRDKIFASYVATEKEDDILFVENWIDTYNREFLLDNAKNDTHFSYLTKMKIYSKAVEDHFANPFDVLNEHYTPSVSVKENLDLPPKYSQLVEAIITPREAQQKYPFMSIRNNSLYISAGVHYINETVIIPANTHLTISPGATLRIQEGVSLISYSPVTAEGTQYRPITLTGATQDTIWGVFAILNTNTATSALSYVNANNGGEDTINGAYISGTIALHNADGSITHTTVSNAHGDDGINIKGGLVQITHSTLDNNSSDGVDLDYIHEDSIFSNNILTDNRGDAIDLSWSNIRMTNNTITTCVDKGISIGEKSNVSIIDNAISNCAIGIAVKDSSQAIITGNTLKNNATAFSLYQKKPYFGGGHATATDNILWQNENLTYTDKLSEIALFNNTTSTIPLLDTPE